MQGICISAVPHSPQSAATSPPAVAFTSLYPPTRKKRSFCAESTVSYIVLLTFQLGRCPIVIAAMSRKLDFDEQLTDDPVDSSSTTSTTDGHSHDRSGSPLATDMILAALIMPTPSYVYVGGFAWNMGWDRPSSSHLPKVFATEDCEVVPKEANSDPSIANVHHAQVCYEYECR
jgi:hypothetical protein